MTITSKRRKFLKNIFTPPSLPRVPPLEVKKEMEMFHSFESLEERIVFFDKMTLEDKFKIFQHLNIYEQADILMHSSTDNANILALCNSLGAGECFVLQNLLKRRNVL